MKTLKGTLAVLPIFASIAFAQTNNEPQTIELGPAPAAGNEQPQQADALQGHPDQAPAQQVFSQQELDQMLAPIALYPDTLLSQILMASTYPIEVVQAARWSKANPGMSGDNAVKAVEQQPWDASVKSLTAFPNVLSMMDEKLDWMERLGDAFLSQEQQVMDTVQQLRVKAQAAGNLQTNDNIRVEPQGQTIVIEQANPQVVYVPYYDPTVIYGPWWYPAYPPVFWRPWPGYYARPGWGPGFFWGTGISVSAGFFFGRVDWPRRNVTVVNVNNYYYRPPLPRPHGPPPGVWYHDPAHRRGVPYRDPQIRREFARPGEPRPDARRDFRGNPPRVMGPEARPATRPEPVRPDTRERVQPRPDGVRPDNSRAENGRPNVAPAPPPNAVPDRSQAPPQQQRPAPQAARPAAPPRPDPESRPHIFEGVGQGPNVRDSSARGRSSFERISPPSPVARPPAAAPAPRPAAREAPAPRQRQGGGGRDNDGQRQQR